MKNFITFEGCWESLAPFATANLSAFLLTYQNYAPNRHANNANFDFHSLVFPCNIVLLQYDKYNPCCSHWLEIFQDQRCNDEQDTMNVRNNQNCSTSLHSCTVNPRLKNYKILTILLNEPTQLATDSKV